MINWNKMLLILPFRCLMSGDLSIHILNKLWISLSPRVEIGALKETKLEDSSLLKSPLNMFPLKLLMKCGHLALRIALFKVGIWPYLMFVIALSLIFQNFMLNSIRIIKNGWRNGFKFIKNLCSLVTDHTLEE